MTFRKPCPNRGLTAAVTLRLLGIAVVVGVAILMIAMFRRDRIQDPAPLPSSTVEPRMRAEDGSRPRVPRLAPPVGGGSGESAADAAAVVASKIGVFARGRLEIARRFAARFGEEVTPEMEAFFEVAAGNDWQGLSERYEALSLRMRGEREPAPTEGERLLWPVLLETFGVVEAAHECPPGVLLEYGKTVLASVPSGGVYVGGTDPGRFIPTLLNETSAEDRRVVMTQNAFADQSYLKYLEFLYGDQLRFPAEADVTAAFKTVVDRMGETKPDGSREVGGQKAVMAINDQLLRLFLDRNPGRAFALEESFPLEASYATAVPDGSLLRLQNPAAGEVAGGPSSSELASTAVGYWESQVDAWRRSAEWSGSDYGREAGAKLVLGQAGVLQKGGRLEEAGRLYELAQDLAPGNPETMFRRASLLVDASRFREALDVVDRYRQAQTDPNRAPDVDALRAVIQARLESPP